MLALEKSSAYLTHGGSGQEGQAAVRFSADLPKPCCQMLPISHLLGLGGTTEHGGATESGGATERGGVTERG